MDQNILLHEVKGQGEPIVLVPGGLSGWLSWIPFAQRLSTERKVVRVQLRSVELAEAAESFPTDYGVLTEREALRATMDKLDLDSLDLAGWSHGGCVSLAFALAYPERVRTLTLIEPEVFWILRESGYDSDALARAEADDRSRSRREVSVRDLENFLVRAGLGRPGDNFEALPQWPVWVRNRQVISILGTLWDYTDSLERLGVLGVPVLAVKGSNTIDLDAAIVDELAAAVPQGRVLELPGGHACHIENIDLFLDELAAHTVSAE
jgi:pimeloyl-ACP methyl ester carboxylesterase